MLDFAQWGRDLGNTLREKDAAYGRAVEKVEAMMRVLYPEGIHPDQFEVALYQVRMLDKQCRLATQPAAYGEDPAYDLAGYALRLAMARAGRTGAVGEEQDEEPAETG